MKSILIQFPTPILNGRKQRFKMTNLIIIFLPLEKKKKKKENVKAKESKGTHINFYNILQSLPITLPTKRKNISNNVTLFPKTLRPKRIN